MSEKNVATKICNIATHFFVYRSNLCRDNISLIVTRLFLVDNPNVCNDMNVLKVKDE